jgi:hypothetical protein
MTKSTLLKKHSGLATLQRPRFSSGLLLDAEDLTAGVDYTRNMMRLMFRSLFGCGVICGLDVKAMHLCKGGMIKVRVSPGVALDCRGNPIEIAKATEVVYEPGRDCDPDPNSKRIWVTVCYDEKCCRPRDISCSSDEDAHVVQTRSHDGFEVKLYDQRPPCACSCEPGEPPKNGRASECCEDDDAETEAARRRKNAHATPCDCYQDHYDGKCSCDCGCCCVLVGIIELEKLVKDRKCESITDDDRKKDFEYCVTTTDRRRIRPVLTGYVEACGPFLRPTAPSGQTVPDGTR